MVFPIYYFCKKAHMLNSQARLIYIYSHCKLKPGITGSSILERNVNSKQSWNKMDIISVCSKHRNTIFHQNTKDAEKRHFIPHLMLLSGKVLQGWKQTSALWPHLTCFFLLMDYFFTANLMSYIRSHSRRQAKGTMIKEALDPQQPFQGQCLIKPDGWLPPLDEVIDWE